MERRKIQRSPNIESVLIIDDNPIDVASLKLHLSVAVRRIDSASAIEEGLNKARLNKYDYILLDDFLPDGRGSEKRGQFIGYGYEKNQVIVMSAVGKIFEKYQAVQQIIGTKDIMTNSLVKSTNVRNEVFSRHDCIQLERITNVESRIVHMEDKLNQITTSVAIIEKSVKTICDRAIEHMADSDVPITGYRDRLLKTENSVKIIIKFFPLIALICSITGGLVSEHLTEMINFLARMVFHG